MSAPFDMVCEAVSLFTLAGSPICVSDTVDTIGEHAWAFQNRELIALNLDGFAGKPVFHSNHGFNWDTAARDTERWVGQHTDGSWVVGLFNRGDAAATRSIAADLTLTVLSGSKVDAGHSGKVTVSSAAGGSWSTQGATVTLGQGRNLVLVTGTGTSTRGPVHLDSISIG